MPSANLFALLDDIASLLDDVAALTKVAARKTAGVLGDDLALNAQQVAGVRAERELPVVWAVARGSLVNKAILVPAALLISAFVPWLITPLLMLGGAYLCFEGFEKLWHHLHPQPEQAAAHHSQLTQALDDPAVDPVALEAGKIRGAVRTDFILSAEIIAITLGAVAGAPLLTQFSVLASVALLLTVGVYGLVAAIVKMDDVGLYLSQRPGLARPLGLGLLRAAPWLMKLLSVAGTAAMFLVGGGILSHGLESVHHWFEVWSQAAGALAPALGMLLDGALGLLAGALVLLVVRLVLRLVVRLT
jgi:predicted DNA repair protein MutK